MNWPWKYRKPEEVINNASSLVAEIDAANAESLAILERLAMEESSHPVFRAISRFVETWEMKMMAVRVGGELAPHTMAELNGAYAIFSDIKNLMAVLTARKPIHDPKNPDADRLFIETLLKQNSTPIR